MQSALRRWRRSISSCRWWPSVSEGIDASEEWATEDPAAQIVGLYRRHAVAWTKARGTRFAEGVWLDRSCAVLDLGGDVLDIGCGSGVPITRHLCRRGYIVTGVDSAPEMVAMFEKNVRGQPAFVAAMRDLKLERRYAGILGWDSFFHLSPADQRRMIAIFRAHAAPGAALMFTSGTHEGTAIGELEGEPLYHASLSQTEYRAHLSAYGFQLLQHVVEDPECGRRTIWLARLFTEATPTNHLRSAEDAGLHVAHA